LVKIVKDLSDTLWRLFAARLFGPNRRYFFENQPVCDSVLGQ
jgi:hypothetical protein